MTAVRVLLFALIPGAWSQSVKSCGGPNDHLKNPVIKLTPDPIVKGGTLTIEASGTLDEDMTAANSNVDLNIKALRIVSVSVKGGVPMSITPGAPKGPFSLTIGPMTLPSNIPGSVVVKGQVHVVNAKNEPVMCIDMDLNVPGMQNELAPSQEVKAPALQTISSCGKAADHMPDFNVATSSGVITMAGTLDEPVAKASIDLDVSLKVLFISVPLKMTIPFAISPGVPKGAIKAVVGPSTIAVSPNVKATLKGTAAVIDGKNEEITCLNIDTVVEAHNKLGDGPGYPTPKGNTQINDEDLIEQYNAANGATWVAGRNDFFNGMTFDDARPLLGTALSHISEHLNNTLADSVYAALSDPPAQFDARTQWSGLVHPIRNQQHCGSCWAFSAAEVLSDRVAIATKMASPSLSPEDLVSCDKGDMGCQGGRLSTAWSYLKNTGIVTDKCFPYTAGNGTAPTCATKCADSESFTRQKASSVFAINGVANMQKEIMTNGPIQVAFMVYKSFMTYKSGVYTKHFWELIPEGGHAVKIVGWGTESGSDYWLVANSWDTTWGLDGFFKIKRGVNECGIETQGPPYAGLPATSATSIVV